MRRYRISGQAGRLEDCPWGTSEQPAHGNIARSASITGRGASMSDGEKADLQRFEDNYKNRCPRG